MGRPEKPIEPQAPYAVFARQLRKLRDNAGSPTYGTLARKTGYSVGALSQAANGWKLPSWKLTRAYATACGGSEQHWREQWMIARSDDLAQFVEAGAWSTRPPSPGTAASVTDFLNCLRALKIWAGDPSYRTLTWQRTRDGQGYWWSKSTVSSVLAPTRTRMPRLDPVIEMVRGFLALGRPDEPLDETYLMEWRQAWTRLYEAQHVTIRPPAEPIAARPIAEVGQASSSTLTPPLRTPGGGVTYLRPVDHDLQPEIHQLANQLRQLFSSLQISTRDYAVRRHMDASTLSRYLSGMRVPPWSFIQALLDDVAENTGRPQSEAVVSYVRSHYREALAVSNPSAYKVAVLEEEVASLQTQLAAALQELDVRRPA